ncbi:hypothetical protein ACRAWF_01395 [Streptomyces sp. L7]
MELGRLRRTRVLARHPAAARTRRDPCLRGRARGPGRPRLHPHGHRHPPDLPSPPRTRSRAHFAAGLLGGGSRFLGVTEDTGRFLHDVLESLDGDLPTDEAGWDASRCARSNGGARPGSSSPASVTTCTRRATPVRPGWIHIAQEEGVFGPHLSLFAAIGRVHPEGAAPDAPPQRRGSVRPPSRTSASRSHCCAASRCWPVRPD